MVASTPVAISRDVMRRATSDPYRPAVLGEHPLTFSELLERARRRAEQLDPAETFVRCGSTEPTETLTDVIAADLAGTAAVLDDPTWPDPVRRAALAAATEAVGGTAKGSRLVVFTSGSTGRPRAVVRTTTSWTYSFPTFSAYAGIEPNDTVLIPGQLSFSLFLFGALHALTVGAAIHPLRRWSPAAGRTALAASGRSAKDPDAGRPGRAGELSRANPLHGCRVAHLVPSMLAPLLQDPGGLRLAIVGGAQLDPGLRQRAEQAGVELIDYYGSSELSFVAIRRNDGPLRPFPGVQVRSRDDVLWVRSPYLASNLDTSPDGFATSGDLGRVGHDGSVLVLGRPDAAITTGGATVQAEGIEQVLRSDPAIGDAVVLGTPHPDLGQVVTALLEPASGGDETRLSMPRLRSLVSERLGAAERPRLWYLVRELPRTGSGKVARSEVASALAENRLDVRTLT